MTHPSTPAADLHGQIMNIQTPSSVEAMGRDDRYAYKMGHRDARHAAAELAATREAALIAERDQLRTAFGNKSAVLDEIRELIGWEDASPVTTIKRLFAERDALRADLNKCKVALVTSIRVSQ